jgi:DNA helicase-2/ATP-dependent DNA helicase PcrA
LNNSANKDLKSSAVEFLNYLVISFDDTELKDDNHDKVILSTVHQAKGLEFKVVFFVHLDENTIPSKRSRSN